MRSGPSGLLILVGACALLAAGTAQADLLVLKDGRVYQTDTTPEVKGDLLVFESQEQKVTLRRTMVDEAKTAELNRLQRAGADGDNFNGAVNRAMASPGTGAPRPIPLTPYVYVPAGYQIDVVYDRIEAEGTPLGEYPLSLQVPRGPYVEVTGSAIVPTWERETAVRERAEREAALATAEKEGAEALAREIEVVTAERTGQVPPSHVEVPPRKSGKAPEADEPEPPPSARPSYRERAAEADRQRLAQVEGQLAEERKNLNALTEIKSNASQLVASDVRSLDADIRRSQRRIESLEAEKARLEKELAGN